MEISSICYADDINRYFQGSKSEFTKKLKLKQLEKINMIAFVDKTETVITGNENEKERKNLARNKQNKYICMFRCLGNLKKICFNIKSISKSNKIYRQINES